MAFKSDRQRKAVMARLKAGDFVKFTDTGFISNPNKVGISGKVKFVVVDTGSSSVIIPKKNVRKIKE